MTSSHLPSRGPEEPSSQPGLSLSLDLGLTWETPKSNRCPMVKSTQSPLPQALPLSPWSAPGVPFSQNLCPTLRHLKQSLRSSTHTWAFSFLFFFFFWLHHSRCRILVPDQGSNPRPLQWKRGVLTTGPPGKSPDTWF